MSRSFLRSAEGLMELTGAGRAVLHYTTRMEVEADALTDTLAQARCVTGTIRVTAVPTLPHNILVPALSDVLNIHPGLTVEVIADARNLNLTLRATDIALRLAAPPP